MIEKLIEIIKYDSESVYVDFKSQEYPLGKLAKKNDLLKDISAMANHPTNEPKYIIIGVKEKNGVASEFIDVIAPTDQAKYQQFIEENIEPKLNFEYKSFEYEGHKLAAFIISGNQDRPYLLKKDVRKSDSHTLEFRIGDGFIRTGTSTRKLTRKDFEEIYSKRNEDEDRRSELIITPILTKYSSAEMARFASFFIIDFSIENLSRKSIGFNAEFRVFYNNGVGLQKKFDFEDKFKEKGLSAIYPQYFTAEVDSTILDLQIEQQQDSFKVTRLRRANEKYAVIISQRDRDECVFFGEILVSHQGSKSGNCIISSELTLRSDDFRSGPLVKKYKVDLLGNKIIN
ncbi:MAG: ATP-binding protein [Saprospiraceae bacterium]